MVEQETKDNVTKKSTWLRFLYMVLFAIIFNIAEVIVVVVVVVQFVTKLFTGDVHERLQAFGDSVALYIAEIIRYLTFHTEDVPFPFGDWPKGQAPKSKRSRKKAAPKEESQENILEAPTDDTPPTGGVGGTDTPPSPSSSS